MDKLSMLLANLLPIVCVVIASNLMWYGKDGWGWLIFIAIITSHTFGTKKKDSDGGEKK